MTPKNKITIKELKQKYNSEGYDALTPEEKTRLFFSYAEKGDNIDKTAENIIKTYGNIFNAANANILSLMNFQKLSPTSAILLKLIPVFSTFCTLYNSDDIKFNSSWNAKNFFYNLLRNNSIEKAVVIALNKNFGIIEKYGISSNNTSKVDISLKKIYEFANNYHAVYIIIAHNHPKGNIKPSEDDITITVKIKKILSHIDVKLVDHIIIGADNALSMREYLNNDTFDYIEDYQITMDE